MTKAVRPVQPPQATERWSRPVLRASGLRSSGPP